MKQLSSIRLNLWLPVLITAIFIVMLIAFLHCTITSKAINSKSVLQICSKIACPICSTA